MVALFIWVISPCDTHNMHGHCYNYVDPDEYQRWRLIVTIILLGFGLPIVLFHWGYTVTT